MVDTVTSAGVAGTSSSPGSPRTASDRARRVIRRAGHRRPDRHRRPHDLRPTARSGAATPGDACTAASGASAGMPARPHRLSTRNEPDGRGLAAYAPSRPSCTTCGLLDQVAARPCRRSVGRRGVVGNMRRCLRPSGPILEKVNVSACWGDAAVPVPWRSTRSTATSDCSTSMAIDVAWLDFVERPRRSSAIRRAPTRPDRPRTSDTSGIRAFTGASGLFPARHLRFRCLRCRGQSRCATAYFAPPRGHRPDRMALGHDEDAQRYETLSAPWSTPGGPSSLPPPGTSARKPGELVRALTFRLVPDRHRQRVGDRLPNWSATTEPTWRPASWHPSLLPALADAVISTSLTTCSSKTRRPHG